MKWSALVFRKQFSIRILKVNFILERNQNEKLKLQYPLNGNLNIRLGNLSLWLKFPVYATTGDPLSLIRTDSDLLRVFFLLNF